MSYGRTGRFCNRFCGYSGCGGRMPPQESRIGYRFCPAPSMRGRHGRRGTSRNRRFLALAGGLWRYNRQLFASNRALRAVGATSRPGSNPGGWLSATIGPRSGRQSEVRKWQQTQVRQGPQGSAGGPDGAGQWSAKGHARARKSKPNVSGQKVSCKTESSV
ncbi:protein of unknown function [Cupriavidus taiwanensis]|uniref:Uncharacterized protein n=1 Tax=Cupriavidus taiwanensis TaxID=164546 RepID=A0A375H249_9BURK|nr:hypothetical protein CBM2588_A240107 [Cupriavidus taiwanensis]SOY85801.1 hypothetical protein CBM2591_A320138 [Cupriavidus taiwanensis]SOZ60369.1 hypothetical protein CBM2617_A330105 [Cupriavidus taiwanensis]SOZ80574.1 hypothetical protein CBM2618_A290107 [Cupriavidus taiwanensis]SOZ81801.1 hypothetical protein CBM2622_A270107 [Cupriavidus taiwanensis]